MRRTVYVNDEIQVEKAGDTFLVYSEQNPAVLTRAEMEALAAAVEPEPELWPEWVEDRDGDWCLEIGGGGLADWDFIQRNRPYRGWGSEWDRQGCPEFKDDVEARLWVQKHFPNAREQQ